MFSSLSQSGNDLTLWRTMIEQGRWQDLRWPDEIDSIISDPPYSARTHKGHNRAKRSSKETDRHSDPLRQLDYSSLSPEDVGVWAANWAPRVRSWIAVMTDHHLAPAWADSFSSAGLYTFAPVPCVIVGMTCRLAGDGPSSWAVQLVVARTRAAVKWGTLPGAYIVNAEHNKEARIGGKPLSLMGQIVRDYSRPGALVVDPCAGNGTTLVAASELGRRVWGCDVDSDCVAVSNERLRVQKAQAQLFEAPVQLSIEG